jgi:hypothetical protein
MTFDFCKLIKFESFFTQGKVKGVVTMAVSNFNVGDVVRGCLIFIVNFILFQGI